MKILFIGDIIGKLGRRVCRELLPGLKAEYAPDLILANGENSAHGNGITEKIYQELLGLGIDVLTMGNHLWDKKEVIKNIDKYPLMIRPANYPAGAPGQDYLLVEKNGVKVAITNVSGRTFMHPLDCPFQVVEKLVPALLQQAKIVIVDIHAEATSEKCALAWFLDGKVSAVLGTHTHVQTADERILPTGTAFITDIGMVGARDSIIGMKRDAIIKRFVTRIPEHFEPAEEGPGIFNAVLLTINPVSGMAKEIKRISLTTGNMVK